jgi:aconitase B
MSDHSLMNPDFLKKELEDSTELLATAETFVREMEIDIDRITDYLIHAPRGYSNSVTLTSEQAREIAVFLGALSINKHRMISPRKVMISHYKQLLQDRRYRIATRLTNLF